MKETPKYKFVRSWRMYRVGSVIQPSALLRDQLIRAQFIVPVETGEPAPIDHATTAAPEPSIAVPQQPSPESDTNDPPLKQFIGRKNRK